MLASERCWHAMVDAFEGTVGALADRLLVALDAAEREGGDARGRQAARLRVSRAESSGLPWQDRVFDLQVVDHSEPLLELRRLVNVKRAYDHLGRAFDLAGRDAAAAAEEADAAHELAPADDQIGFWRATILAGAGGLDEAVPAFREAVRAHPGWPEYLRNCVAAGLVPQEAQALADMLV
jgi:uncharacterized Ntn-hydrolase superfamily protein